MKKNKKEKYVDDGHTIYNMDVDGMPIVLGVIVCFFLAMLFILLWLK